MKLTIKQLRQIVKEEVKSSLTKKEVETKKTQKNVSLQELKSMIAKVIKEEIKIAESYNEPDYDKIQPPDDEDEDKSRDQEVMDLLKAPKIFKDLIDKSLLDPKLRVLTSEKNNLIDLGEFWRIMKLPQLDKPELALKATTFLTNVLLKQGMRLSGDAKDIFKWRNYPNLSSNFDRVADETASQEDEIAREKKRSQARKSVSRDNTKPGRDRGEDWQADGPSDDGWSVKDDYRNRSDY